MFNKLKSIFLFLVCLALFVLPLFTLAQEGFFGEAETATGMIRNIYWFGVVIVGFAAVVAIVIAGIMYMQSYGDPQKITQAKQLLGGALIGMVLLLFSYTILRTINPALVRLREPMLEVELEKPECLPNGTSCNVHAECCSGRCDPQTRLCITPGGGTAGKCNEEDPTKKHECCKNNDTGEFWEAWLGVNQYCHHVCPETPGGWAGVGSSACGF